METCDTRLKLSEHDNLLDVLLLTGHEIDYQCRGGYCGSCRVTVSGGSVEYDDLPLAHIGADEILPCCCKVIEPLKIDVCLRKKISKTKSD
ncbi:MAG: 2Fe-2S iron-sulfur cluster binding domain-containing protein [Gammaproteobacteria bacterium]|nr:2Fe-2S iron-sulfur cluster binding domain-containing protein [Gammaproteobacteria bacterium]